MRTTRLVSVLTVGVFAVGGLTACAGDGSGEASNVGRDARELADQASELLREVEDFRVTGTVDSEGMRATVEGCVRRGADFEARISFGDGVVEFLQVGGNQYMKGDIGDLGTMASDDDEDTAEARELLDRLDGRYLKVPDDDSEDDSLFGLFDPFSDGTEGIVTGDPVRIDGVWLIPLSVPKEDDEDDVATVYVRERGRPYPVMVKTEGSEVGTIKYTKGKERCMPVEPPADRIVDAAELFGEDARDEPVL